MKPLAAVEKTRQEYHQAKNKKTVHRSSLLVPHMKGSSAVISFLNHFLLKRHYTDVSCKITGIDAGGKLFDSVTIEVSEPKVYSINLGTLFEREMPNYLVEFYSAKNLYIPFPAVIINHVGKDFCNVVHSYNRVLNDIFEDDAINQNHCKEASIDVIKDKHAESFIIFSSGILDVDDVLSFEYISEDKKIARTLPVKQERLTHSVFTLSDIFSDDLVTTGGILKISQPPQKLFYGRLLAGIMLKDSKSFSANHSYYDSSESAEYWEKSDHSYRTYPFFKELKNAVRMYPIMSPSKIEVWIEFRNKNSDKISSEKYTLTSPSSHYLEININDIIKEKSLKDVMAYTVNAKSMEGNIPTRVNHNLVLAGEIDSSHLSASINMSLINDSVFVPKEKLGYSWGQCVVGAQYSSKLGMTFNSPLGEESEVTLEFYSGKGLVRSFQKPLQPGQALMFDMEEVVKEMPKETEFLWYIAKSARSDLAAYSMHMHKTSRHASGEHNF